MIPSKLVFLPGAAGLSDYWRAVSDAMAHPGARCLLGWPGFADVPARPDVQGFDDLVRLVRAEIDQPCAFIAQSMGGAVALEAVLRHLDDAHAASRGRVTHLVLAVTSGGIAMDGLGAQDWRAAFLAERPQVPRWLADLRLDLSAQLHRVRQPSLLIWGDADPISPVAVGRRLLAALPSARLEVLSQAGHDLALTHARAVAGLIDQHLTTT